LKAAAAAAAATDATSTAAATAASTNSSDVDTSSTATASSTPSSVALSLDLGCEVAVLHELPLATPDGYPVALVLTDGRRLECDLVVSATGVRPNTDWCPPELTRAAEEDGGGILVDECMRTSLPDVFAAGDCATLRFSSAFMAQHPADSPNLFHSTRLWSHAKMLGLYAARAMSGEYTDELIDLGGFNFLLFAHTTTLFGRKTILLGKYNLQGYSVDEVRQLKSRGELRTLVRCKPGGCEEFIKLHLLHDRIIGAMLIGGEETADLEETFENLMLNQSNLEQFGDFLNDVDIDLADYFD
jgi:hypothetical protein